MSSNRLIYDNCAYEQKLNVSTGPSNYSMYPGKYEHSSKCRIQLGQVGGNGVSIYDGNMVDLESDLMGIDRRASMCSTSKYQPACKSCSCGGVSTGLPCDCLKCRSKNLVNQPSCQMVEYGPVIEAPEFVPQTCQYDSRRGGTYRADGTFLDKVRAWFN
jgi:hypothetical protein